MADVIRIGILGGGWPGRKHARAFSAIPSFKLTAVADLIPARRKALMDEFEITAQYAEAMELIEKAPIDAVAICLPNYLHAPVAVAALKAGKHVLCEVPVAMTAREAKQMAAAAAKSGKTLLYAAQRRFGANEQAAHQAIAKGYAGTVYHARSSWMRTRAVPIGTGWFTDKSKSGGGALIDLGFHMLDLAWYLLGQPKPASAFALTHHRLTAVTPAANPAPADGTAPPAAAVEDAAFAMIRFEGGQSLELSASWAINQPPSQNGAACRLNGDLGAVDVYTPSGAIMYRSFGDKGECKETPLKLPKLHGHAALARHFRECILGKCPPLIGPDEGVMLMEMIEAVYKSAASGKSAGV